MTIFSGNGIYFDNLKGSSDYHESGRFAFEETIINFLFSLTKAKCIGSLQSVSSSQNDEK